MSNSLLSTLQAVQQGSQAGDAASQGLIPSPAQPRGSQQLYIKSIGALRGEVANLNSLIDGMFREAGTDDVLHKAVEQTMECVRKLQGVSTTLEAHLKELAAQSATPTQGAQQMPTPAM